MSTSLVQTQQQLSLRDTPTNSTEEREFYSAEILNTSPFLENLVTKFPVDQGDVYCVNENGEIAFYMDAHKIKKDRIKKFKKHEINGIPEDHFTNVTKMRAFLSQAYKRTIAYTDNSGFKLRVDLNGLKGGGNMMAPGEGLKWEVKGDAENAKIIIPYRLTGSVEYCNANKILNEPKTSMRRSQLLAQIDKGQQEKIRLEKEAHEAIVSSIEGWNHTNVVELISVEEYQERYRSQPKRWIGFHTYNEEGICQAPCIGMCPGTGEHIITCDIEGRFHSDPVQSIMHEIGHVIGLRHEHARKDRKKYVKTNLKESLDGVAFGKYDFKSIMHYALGDYGKDENDVNQYLYLSNALRKKLKEKTIQKREETVGKTPSISAGDIATVKKLYEPEFNKLKKEKHDAEARGVTQLFSALSLSATGGNKPGATAGTAAAAANSQSASAAASAAGAMTAAEWWSQNVQGKCKKR